MDAALIYKILGGLALLAVFGTAAVFALRGFRSGGPESDYMPPTPDPFPHRTFGQTALPHDDSSSWSGGGDSGGGGGG